VLQLLSIGGAKQKAADLFLAAFFICDPSQGEKSPSGTAERKENVQWTFVAKERAGALAK